MVFIGTGRLHCFRKMTTDELPTTDAHFELRSDLLASGRFDGNTLCVSIAYDWYVSAEIEPLDSNQSLFSDYCRLMVFAGCSWV
jgi:hypothetical protein